MTPVMSVLADPTSVLPGGRLAASRWLLPEERALQCIFLIFSLFHAVKFIAVQVSLAGDMESLFVRPSQIHLLIAGWSVGIH